MTSGSNSGEADLQATIEEQRRTIEELQTPVLQVWDGILASPSWVAWTPRAPRT